MSTTMISVEHNFETGHRLPFMEGKCQSIHGHSWLTRITVSGRMDETGIIADYGSLKRVVREWIDRYLDHGTMLGIKDNLLDAFLKDGSKVFIFGRDEELVVRTPGEWYEHRPWPTVESVAEMLAYKIQPLLAFGVTIESVLVRETAVNYAEWRRALGDYPERQPRQETV